MSNRIILQTRLETVLGSRNVYFSPPKSVQMQFPAIVYSREPMDKIYADNDVYLQKQKYKVVLIDKRPDSPIFYALTRMQYCRHITTYQSDNMNHDVFEIYN